MLRSLLFLPLLVACSTDGKTDDTAETGENGGENSAGCGVSVKSTVPAAGDASAYYRANIEFELTDVDSSATISTDIAGSQTTSADGKTVIWVPDAPLEAATSYTVTLNYCAADPYVLTFSTSEIGPAVSGIEGNTYALDLTAARIVEPPGIGAVLSAYLTTQVLIGVVSIDGSSIQMMGALAVEKSNPASQDYCDPSIAFPAADFSGNPFFSIGPQDTTFSVAGYEIDIESLNITGSFAPDGSYIDGATLSGTIDTRPLAPLLDDSGNKGAICDLAVNFGAACEPCPSDGEPYCLTLVADQIFADGVPGALVEVTGNDCEGCESGPPAEDAVCKE